MLGLPMLVGALLILVHIIIISTVEAQIKQLLNNSVSTIDGFKWFPLLKERPC
jgi:hypothetical protein